MRQIFDCECIEHLLLIVFFARQLIIKEGRGDAITQQLIRQNSNYLRACFLSKTTVAAAAVG
jgi:hypothetical protein